MGLDTVELVMEFEDEFQIQICDADAEELRTVGQTCDYIVAAVREKFGGRSVSPCRTAWVFREVRAGLGAWFGVSRAAVRPSAAVGELIPPGPARVRWGEFARMHGLPKAPWSFFPERRFPREGTTLADLVRRVRPVEFCDANGNVDAERVRDKVRVIVAEQLGLELKEVQLSSRYIEDLNAG